MWAGVYDVCRDLYSLSIQVGCRLTASSSVIPGLCIDGWAPEKGVLKLLMFVETLRRDITCHSLHIATSVTQAEWCHCVLKGDVHIPIIQATIVQHRDQTSDVTRLI